VADKATVKPTRVRVHSRDLNCDVVRIVGYRYECDCGARGTTRRTMMLARQDKIAHARTHDEGRDDAATP
jgi:hypothetical protein